MCADGQKQDIHGIHWDRGHVATERFEGVGLYASGVKRCLLLYCCASV